MCVSAGNTHTSFHQFTKPSQPLHHHHSSAFGHGLIADTWGRRAAFITTTAMAGGAGLLAAAADASWQIIALRLVAGAGVGGSPAALALFTEVLPRRQRGRAFDCEWMSAIFICTFSPNIAKRSRHSAPPQT